MKSDLANAVKDVALGDQDDRFLATHFLAGQHELDELDELLEQLAARRREAAAIHGAIAKTLRERHAKGINFTIGKALIQVPSKKSRGSIKIARTEVLEP